MGWGSRYPFPSERFIGRGLTWGAFGYFGCVSPAWPEFRAMTLGEKGSFGGFSGKKIQKQLHFNSANVLVNCPPSPSPDRCWIAHQTSCGALILGFKKGLFEGIY